MKSTKKQVKGGWGLTGKELKGVKEVFGIGKSNDDDDDEGWELTGKELKGVEIIGGVGKSKATKRKTKKQNKIAIL
jgi:hypothetical protein